MRRNVVAVGIAGLALALTLTACGGSDDETAARAISDSIMEEQEGGAADVFTMKRAEADCIGEGFVAEIGVEQLQEYGFLTEDLDARAMTDVKMSASDAEEASGVLFDCADVLGLMTKALASGQDLDAATRACLEEVLTEDALRSLFTLMFSGRGNRANEEIIGPMMACAAPS